MEKLSVITSNLVDFDVEFDLAFEDGERLLVRFAPHELEALMLTAEVDHDELRERLRAALDDPQGGAKED